jgi:D-aminopeptidase
MAEQFETPAEREAKLSAQNARINEVIAEDVAIGMAEKAEQERLRANAIARGNINLQREANEAQFRAFMPSMRRSKRSAKRIRASSAFGSSRV